MYFLYLKTHKQTKLKYLGYTNKNPHKYKGSGTYWKRHLKIHGENVLTKILLRTQKKEEIVKLGLYFSKRWNIVDSPRFANLKLETGDGGRMPWDKECRAKVALYWNEENRKKVGERMSKEIRTEQWKNNIRRGLIGKPLSDDRKKKISKTLTGKSQPKIRKALKELKWYFNPLTKEVIRIHHSLIPPLGFLAGRGIKFLKTN